MNEAVMESRLKLVELRLRLLFDERESIVLRRRNSTIFKTILDLLLLSSVFQLQMCFGLGR